jgi:TGS domain
MKEARIRAHWERVATTLDGFYQNPALTKAGFWHGTAYFKPENEVEIGAVDIIEKWRQIYLQMRAIEPSELPAQLEKWHTEKPALILFIVEKYDHYDPEQKLCALSANWRKHSLVPVLADLLCFKQAVAKEASRNANPAAEILRLQFYGDIAESLGLTTYRDGFYLLDFLYKDSGNVESSLTSLRGMVASTFLPQATIFKEQVAACFPTPLVTPVTDAYTPNFPSIYWRWDRLDRILDKIASSLKKAKSFPISYFGHIGIKFSKEAECYQALGTLCTHFPHRAEIHDSIGIRTPTSKRSIDLTLVLADAGEGTQGHQPVVVSIYQRDGEVKYWRKVLEQNVKLLHNAEVSVFTKDGEVKRIAAPARLVDFAYTIHVDFIVYFDHALINGRREENLLGILQHGDKVELVKGQIFRWPPPKWLESLSRVDRVRHKAVLKARLLDKALNFFAKKYLANNDGDCIPKNELYTLKLRIDKIYQEHLKSFTDKQSFKRLEERARRGDENRQIFSDLFLMQIVFFHKNELGWPYATKPKITERAIRSIAKEIVYITAPQCDNTMRASLDKSLSLEFYVTVSVERPGLVFDQLQIFHQQKVPILEVVARASLSGKTYTRITIPEQPRYRQERILVLLRREIGNGPIRLLDESSLPCDQETALPQRMVSFNASYFDVIPTNRPVSEPYLFYGREEEIKKIFAVITRCATGVATSGGLILITGLIKVGKTSLALHVIDKLKHGYSGTGGKSQPRLTIHIRLGPHITVGAIEEKILAEVATNWLYFSAACGCRPHEPTPQSMGDLIHFFKRRRSRKHTTRPLLLIFIDEIGELFAADNLALEQNATQFVDFSNLFETTPGAVLMVAGPQYPLRHYSMRFGNKFDSFEKITVTGLDARATTALINRENLHAQGKLPIKIQQDICTRFFVETRGNPWWLANLTNQLRENGTDLIGQFNDSAYEQFITNFVVRNHLFSYRFLSKPPPQTEKAFASFKDIIHTQIHAGEKLELSVEKLLTLDNTITHEEASRLLTAQTDVGGLLLAEYGKYRCSAPILERWLQEAVLSGRY